MPAPDHHLMAFLVDFLRLRGTTIRYAPLPGDARWNATTHTLTLRADADPDTHLDVIFDHIRVNLVGLPSRLGAQPARHLRLVSA